MGSSGRTNRESKDVGDKLTEAQKMTVDGFLTNLDEYLRRPTRSFISHLRDVPRKKDPAAVKMGLTREGEEFKLIFPSPQETYGFDLTHVKDQPYHFQLVFRGTHSKLDLYILRNGAISIPQEQEGIFNYYMEETNISSHIESFFEKAFCIVEHTQKTIEAIYSDQDEDSDQAVESASRPKIGMGHTW